MHKEIEKLKIHSSDCSLRGKTFSIKTKMKSLATARPKAKLDKY